MTEDEARAWLAAHPVAGPALPMLERYVALLIDESGRQNLIAPSTIGSIWARHIVDSAQLWDLAPFATAAAADIGSGAGLPGMVLGIMGATIVLVEPRRLRAEFLARCAGDLALSTVSVRQQKAAAILGTYSIVTARAVTSPAALFDDVKSANVETVWVLPRGESAHADLTELKRDFAGMFHVERSVTSDSSSIIVARNVRRRR